MSKNIKEFLIDQKFLVYILLAFLKKIFSVEKFTV